jgi:cation transport protein ChaC
MWSPGFEPGSVHPARILGWHRRFSRVSVTSWGSPDQPGLCAALHAGGTAWGRILEIPTDGRAAILAYLDDRERAYLRRQVHVEARIAGVARRLTALTYVADPADPTLSPELGPKRAREYARRGIGTKGAAFDYVRNTMLALSEDGHRTSDAHRFFAMIAR